MRLRRHRRQVLFVVALGLPCLVLVSLGAMLLRNGQELAQSRLAEDRRRQLAQIASELLANLERIKLEEAGHLAAIDATGSSSTVPYHPEVALIAWIREDHLFLPWETDPQIDHFTQMVTADTPYAAAIKAGERQEIVLQQLAEAAASYQRAHALARDDVGRDYANLLRARAIVKQACECTDEARHLFTSLLNSRAVDDQGVPLALYAANQLLHAGADLGPLVQTVDRFTSQNQYAWIAPAAASLARNLLDGVMNAAPNQETHVRGLQVSSRLAGRTAEIEHAIALQRDFPDLFPPVGLPAYTTDPKWLSYKGAWLVSEAPSLAGRPPFVIAIRAAPVFEALNTKSSMAANGTLRFLTGGSAGQPVGAAFPELRVGFASSDHDQSLAIWRQQRLFYSVALLTVVGGTVLGGLVFWRDVRRELQLAELRSQFVASVSHELRTPLTAIRMFAETLQMARPLDSSARAEYLNTIVSESERLTRLINNVLDFSKIERGQRIYRLGPASIAAIVRNAAGALQYPLARQGFQLRVDVPDDMPMVRVDEDAIQQAVLNLLSNAMKYSRERREIDLRVAGVQGHAVIEVTDYGLGIPQNEQARIFDRFYRASVPENARIPGAGLGLALVDHIVKAHGGSVTVRSAPGHGSTFAIRLPLDTAA
jgi:signal transduction histidine kinase